jgi:hypothetical protein
MPHTQLTARLSFRRRRSISRRGAEQREVWDRASKDIESQSVEVTHPRLLGTTALSRPYSSFLEVPA